MHAQALEISWHDSSSVWAVDTSQSAGITRLVTAGGDKTARVWRLCSRSVPSDASNTPQVEVKWVCDLRAHTSTVNVARFAPGGRLIASAADGGEIALWACELDARKPAVEAASTSSGDGSGSTTEHTGPAFSNASEVSGAERWACVRTLRGHVHDVLDLSWSSCGNILASASVDNSVMVWNLRAPQTPPIALRQHSNFVQGVAVHPGGDLLASLGNDRLLRIFSRTSSTVQREEPNWKLVVVAGSSPRGDHRLFVDDVNSKNVFRRLAWSPDGNILACPSGVEAPPIINRKIFAVHIFSRHQLNFPIAQCGGLTCPAVVVRFCPLLFELRKNDITVRRKDGGTNTADARNSYHLLSGTEVLLQPQGAPRTEMQSSNESGMCNSSPDVIHSLQDPVSLVAAPAVASAHHKPNQVTDDCPSRVNSFTTGAVSPQVSMPARELPLNQTSAATQPMAPNSPVLAGLPYRMVFAVGCTDAIYLYDTQSFKRPIAHVSGLHLAEHTDLSWTPDGRYLVVSSTDGYVSLISFSDSELGIQLAESAVPRITRSYSGVSASAPQLSSAALKVVVPRRAMPKYQQNLYPLPSGPQE